MALSDEFYRRIKKARTKQEIESVFSNCLPCPDEMSHELISTIKFDVYKDSEPEHQEYSTLLASIVDLFDQEFDKENCKLPKSVWEIIRDITNSYAEHLDEEVMAYVFQQILIQGLI